MKQWTLTSVSGQMLFMIGMKRDIIYDLDGSLSLAFDGNVRTSATILHKYPHISTYHQSNCLQPSTAANWDNAIICDKNITIRRVMFTNLLNLALFKNQQMKVMEIASINQTLNPNMSTTLYSAVESHLPNIFM